MYEKFKEIVCWIELIYEGKYILSIKLPDDCFNVWSVKLTVVERRVSFFTIIFRYTDEL